MSIQIRQPIPSRKWKDWTEGELITMSFIYMLEYWKPREEIDYRVEYRMSEIDFYTMMNLKAFATNMETQLERMRRIFRIGHFPGYFTIQWKPECWEWRKDGRNQMRITSKYCVIERPKQIKIWYYLMARLAHGGLYTEEMSDQELSQYYKRPLLHRADAMMLSLRDDLFRDVV